MEGIYISKLNFNKCFVDDNKTDKLVFWFGGDPISSTSSAASAPYERTKNATHVGS